MTVVQTPDLVRRDVSPEWRMWWAQGAQKDGSARRAVMATPLLAALVAGILAAFGVLPAWVAALAIVVPSFAAPVFFVVATRALWRQPHVLSSECESWRWINARPGLIEAARSLPSSLDAPALARVADHKPFAIAWLPWTVRTVESMRAKDEAFVVALAWLAAQRYDVSPLLQGSTRQVYSRVLSTALREAAAAKVAARV